MEDLKRNRQALTATVFQEGRPISFEGNVLKIEFPADSDFHAGEASKSRHSDALGDVLEEHFGVRPRLECQLADGAFESPASLREEPHREISSQTAGRADNSAGVGETSREAPDEANGPNAGAAPNAAGLDDTIGSEDEVFEMAREWRSSRDPDEGNQR